MQYFDELACAGSAYHPYVSFGIYLLCGKGGAELVERFLLNEFARSVMEPASRILPRVLLIVVTPEHLSGLYKAHVRFSARVSLK